MKLLILTDGIHPFVIGGMQKHSYNLALGLHLAGHEVEVYHCTYNDEQLRSLEQHQLPFKATHVSFPHASIKIPGHYIKSSKKYSELLYEKYSKDLSSFDGVYAQGYSAWHYLLLRKNNIAPVAVNFHGLNMFQDASGLKSKLENKMLSKSVKENLDLADYTISLGGKLTQVLETLVPKNKIVECPNGINEDWIIDVVKLSANKKRKLIFIGRNDKVKCLDFLLKEIKPYLKNIELTIVGDVGDLASNSDPNIIFLGNITEESTLIEHIDQSNALVLTSTSEGQPTVIMEAMGRGKVIISSDVGAVKDMVDTEGGWTFEPLHVSEFNSVIHAFLETPDTKLLEMGKYNVTKVTTQFTWRAVCERTASIFIRE
ncbi:MAG: glycosyltransferase involved in cell wall biosynthesis [Parvicellaceae bacterium]